MSDQLQPIEVRRFDFVVAGVGDPEDGRNLRKASTEESEHGGWVPFEDHERATTNLKQRIEELEGELADQKTAADEHATELANIRVLFDGAPTEALNLVRDLKSRAEDRKERLATAEEELSDLRRSHAEATHELAEKWAAEQERADTAEQRLEEARGIAAEQSKRPIPRGIRERFLAILAALDTSEQEGRTECKCSTTIPNAGDYAPYATAGCPVHGAASTSPSERLSEGEPG